MPKGHGDGSEWDVSPDIELLTGVKQNLFAVEVPDEHSALRVHFADEPMFLHIIDALLELDQGTQLRD